LQTSLAGHAANYWTRDQSHARWLLYRPLAQSIASTSRPMYSVVLNESDLWLVHGPGQAELGISTEFMGNSPIEGNFTNSCRRRIRHYFSWCMVWTLRQSDWSIIYTFIRHEDRLQSKQTDRQTNKHYN